jgi:uncharacterized membrane protein YfcA
VLIFFGLEGALANGTNRIGILIQNVFAVTSFRRQEKHAFRKSFLLALFTVPGAIAGAALSVRISHDWFQRILAIVMLGIVVSMFLPRRTNRSNAASNSGGRNGWGILALFAIGFYGGFIQMGVGFLLMACLYHLFRFDLVTVNMHKVFIVLLYTMPALCVFIWTGNVHLPYGLALATGMGCGAWWGARIAVKGGESMIRRILAVALIVMALRLLNVI